IAASGEAEDWMLKQVQHDNPLDGQRRSSFQPWRKFHDPVVIGGMINFKPALRGHLFKIPVAQLIGKIPADMELTGTRDTFELLSVVAASLAISSTCNTFWCDMSVAITLESVVAHDLDEVLPSNG
ncbi:MAG TPA: hypothetical protein VE954_34920, partial [Oligoflexus sp.]|uniref:hypothetical protein n=1 Tax=Oligoflexus sp. TaxID=1971216 RepID=UPI002D3EE39E